MFLIFMFPKRENTVVDVAVHCRVIAYHSANDAMMPVKL